MTVPARPRRRLGSRLATTPVPLPPPAATVPAAFVALTEVLHAAHAVSDVAAVQQFALERIGPVSGARCAALYLVDGDSELLRLSATWGWPEAQRPWLDAMRVRIGFGPTGEAAAERRAIEVADLRAPEMPDEWRDLSTELDVHALLALPIVGAQQLLGVLTFYFAAPGALAPDQRHVLRFAAEQLGLALAKLRAEEARRRAEAAQAESDIDAGRAEAVAAVAQRGRDDFLSQVTYDLRTPLAGLLSNLSLLATESSGQLTAAQRGELAAAQDAAERLRQALESLLDAASLQAGEVQLVWEEFDPRAPVREALRDGAPADGHVRVEAELPVLAVPPMRSDRRTVARILVNLIREACARTLDGAVRVSVDVDAPSARVRFRVRDAGAAADAAAQATAFDVLRRPDGAVGTMTPLARGRDLARLLGGTLELHSVVGMSEAVLDLPIVPPAGNGTAG